MNLWKIHGWKSRGRGVRLIADALKARGYSVKVYEYGFTLGFFSTIFKTAGAATALSTLTEKHDVVIGHSNGCNVIAKAAKRAEKRGYPFASHAIYISPALNCKTPSYALEKIDVLHTHKDAAVKAATFLPFSSWGRMGARGYKGDDPAYTNHDCTDRIWGHSDWFDPCDINYTADRIEELL